MIKKITILGIIISFFCIFLNVSAQEIQLQPNNTNIYSGGSPAFSPAGNYINAPAVNNIIMDPNQTAGQPISSPSTPPGSATYGCAAVATNLGDILCKIGTIIKSLVPLLMAIATVVFIWGVITYVMAKEDEDKSKARNKIIYGIIGLAVIVAMWGLVSIVTNTFGIANQSVSIEGLTSYAPPAVTSSTTGQSICSGILVPNAKIGDWMKYISCNITSSIIPFIFGLAVLAFIYGVVQYIAGAQEQEKRDKGRTFMIWGIIALTVMVSVWGLVKIVGNTFGIEYVIPQL